MSTCSGICISSFPAEISRLLKGVQLNGVSIYRSLNTFYRQNCAPREAVTAAPALCHLWLWQPKSLPPHFICKQCGKVECLSGISCPNWRKYIGLCGGRAGVLYTWPLAAVRRRHKCKVKQGWGYNKDAGYCSGQRGHVQTLVDVDSRCTLSGNRYSAIVTHGNAL